MSAKLDLVLHANTDFSESYIWKDSEKTPIPMLNWTGILEIREASNLAVELTLTTGNGITLGANDGSILIDITKAQIASLTFRTGLYTFILTNTDLESTLFSTGTITKLRGE